VLTIQYTGDASHSQFVLHAELNENVFSNRLKEAVHLVDLSSQGNLLQIRGAATCERSLTEL